MRFVDTNVLLYAVSTAPDECGKATRARSVLDAQDLAVSVQVLQEFYVQATRPGRDHPLSHQQATRLVESFMRYPVQDNTVAVMLAAFGTADRWHLAYWDAAVIEAARAAGCDTVLSEDLGDGQDFAGVRVENPFRGL